MNETFYTEEHQWIRVDGDIETVGISDFAQNQLGEIVFVELPAVGRQFVRNEEAAVVESAKSASEVYCPVAGEVLETNAALDESPTLVNTGPEGDGWFFRIRVTDPAELSTLMDETAYRAFSGI